MTLSTDLALVELGLDTLEEFEIRSLVWGLIDNPLTAEEVDGSLRATLQTQRARDLLKRADCSIATARDLHEQLVRLKMLFPALNERGQPTGWRTRMAEGVRLIAQLRQLFPKHQGESWTESATLVADYRILRRPRRYPRRDVSPKTARMQFAEGIDDPRLLEAVAHWLDQMPTDRGLARFQVDAAVRILQGLQAGTRAGTLISAGTGSGKTLAFYLPALAWLASQRAAGPAAPGVRVLALYPRNELLKDQLTEVYEQCRRFDAWLARSGGRPLRVGVLYGETPRRILPGRRMPGWERDAKGATCPFFRCPTCGGDMRVLEADLEVQTQRLICSSCQCAVDADTLAYTRDVIARDPPDILFTSVEMLNRHLPSVDLRHVFGVGPHAHRAPDLLLMDEVHLYAGTYGAQVAYLMRRWWAASGRRSSFVGLSATLADGRAFFASLTGLAENATEEIRPLEDDIVHEGAEYLLALRGDPVSQSALLSTTIQTLMLGARLLDPRQRFHRSDAPFYGWRAFVFTDQLDAANRLFRDLLDAEGRLPDGRVNAQRHPLGGLARLRAPMEPPGRRYLRGQDWRVPREIGHALTDRLQITRTTSYDSGVSPHSEVVVATAALEVGFDDEAVGLVVQHKAPRDVAAFLQRKGRAGRTRHTRPWTIVVLSDYGRDRMAYQAYDQLFDPELPPRQLPLGNRYVQRMQAVYALLDELGERTQAAVPRGVVWMDLRGPARLSPRSGWSPDDLRPVRAMLREPLPQDQSQWKVLKGRARREAPPRATDPWAGANWLEARLRQHHLLQVLSSYLQSEEQAQQLSRKLAGRLGLPQEQVALLMWTQPRPVLLGAIPTAQRRLSSNWRSGESPEADYQAGHPLPDFVPANLFDDLSLPEMRLDFPGDAGNRLSEEYMPVQQCLGEFAPGRVSRRFNDPFWLGFDDAQLTTFWSHEDDQPIEHQTDVSVWYDLDPQQAFYDAAEDHVVPLLAFRPLGARLCRADRVPGLRVSDTSNAQLVWSSNLHAQYGADVLHPPAHVGIASLIREMHAHTHGRQNAARVRRYARGSRAGLRITKGQETRRFTVDCRFTHNGQPCGVGFEIETDALVLMLEYPGALHAAIEWTPERMRAARAARYNFETQHNSLFAATVQNSFLRGWIAQIFLIAVILRADGTGDLRAALDELAAGQHPDLLLSVLPSVFQAPDDDAGDATVDRLRQTLEGLLQQADVLQAVRNAARVLVETPDATWDEWLSLEIRTTLGAACLDAIQHACPQVDTDGLVVDVDPGLLDDGSRPQCPQVWISEVNPGGNGLIEQVVELLVAQPDALFRHIEAALGPQDFEFGCTQLRQVADWLGGDHPDVELSEAVARVREASNAGEAQTRFGELRAALTRRGQSVFHGYAVSLSMRFLRPRTPPALDRLVDKVSSSWEVLENRLGIEIDVRVACALHSDDSDLDHAFATLGLPLPAENRRHWRFSVLMGILWARGHALRAVALPLSNRFTAMAIATERLLLTQWLSPRPPTIDPRDPGWLGAFHEALRSRQSATVALPAAEAARCLPRVTQAVVVEPIQFDYLNVYARLTEVKRYGDRIEWTFSVPEPT